jgi:hypothetical protein
MEAKCALFAPPLVTKDKPEEVLTVESFLPTLRLEERTLVPTTANFLEGFSDFTSINSCSDVLSPVREEAPFRLLTPLIFFGVVSAVSTSEPLRFSIREQ